MRLATVNVFEAAAVCRKLQPQFCIPQTRFIMDADWSWAIEIFDPLGGKDPKCSKACAELIAGFLSCHACGAGQWSAIATLAVKFIGGGDGSTIESS